MGSGRPASPATIRWINYYDEGEAQMFDVAAIPVPARSNLKDVVAEAIRAQIFAGRLVSGSRIDQAQLAVDLRVSRLPVREALISLEQEGWVRNVPRQGSFVAVLTQNDLLDHYRIFGTVCALAAERAAIELTDAQLDTLETISKQMRSEPDTAAKQRLNHQFHATINRAGSSVRLASAIRTLAASIPARLFEFNSGWDHDKACDQHEEILAALRARNGEAAAHAVLEHLTEGGTFAVNQLGNAGFWDRETSGRE
jgi:DNA-binding GntR family transcriptional regulator